MIRLIIISFLFLPFTLAGQIMTRDVGLIHDSNGYTLIRKGISTSAPIKDTLFEKELFFFTPNDSTNWYEVHQTTVREPKSEPINWLVYKRELESPGYVHKSRIRNIKSLDKATQVYFIDSLFQLEIDIHHGKYKLEDLLKNKTLMTVEFYHPVLDLLVYYLCRNDDKKILDLYFQLLTMLSGSPDEALRYPLGYLYLCIPDMIINKIDSLNNDNLKNELDFGFHVATWGRKDEIENYDELKKKLDEFTGKPSDDYSYEKFIFDSLAVINDTDGYSNVREKPVVNSKVLFKEHSNNIIRILPFQNSEWWEIEQYYPNRQAGYIYKNRLKNLGNLTNDEMRELSYIILDSTIALRDELHFKDRLGLSDTDENKELTIKFKDYYHFQLFPVLKLVSKYYCNTYDRKFLRDYLDFRIETKRMAWEATPATLVNMFICNPDQVLEEIDLRLKSEIKTLLNDLEWGIEGIEDKTQKDELKVKMESIRPD